MEKRERECFDVQAFVARPDEALIYTNLRFRRARRDLLAAGTLRVLFLLVTVANVTLLVFSFTLIDFIPAAVIAIGTCI